MQHLATMKYFIFLVQLVLILTPPTSTVSVRKPEIPVFVKVLRDLHRAPPGEAISKRANVHTRWITQILDHFDDSNNATWQQRIMIKEKYFVDGSPIFIYLGGEWAIEDWHIEGLLGDISKKHKGTALTIEHRFFGESFPIRPLSIENFKKYLNVNQALADVVNIIKILKEEDKYKDSKVVVSGCSYSATMATWLKKLYPDVIVGSWASSAPLEAKLDFKDFMEGVGESYRVLGGQSCYDIIDNATSYYEDLFKNGKGAQAKKELNLCSSFDENKEKDQWQLFSTIANIFANIAQTQVHESNDIPRHCKTLRDFSSNDYEALSKFFQSRLSNPACVSITYKDSAYYYTWTIDFTNDDEASWFFQTCNEFGWFQSSASIEQPFGSNFPATLYTSMCEDVFGPKYSEAKIEKRVKKTNEAFDGIDIDVENVLFTHGGLDAWRKVGAGEAEGAIIIPKASHCSDLQSISKNDSPELQSTKRLIKKTIGKWLA